MLEDYRKRINKELERFFDAKINVASGEEKHLTEKIKEYTLRGGKRIRPVLTVLAYKCFKEDDKIIPASVAMELIHSYLLIHDDIMDEDDLRRGKPSMHKMLGEGHRGMSAAILAGDLCNSWINESILESEFSKENKLKALKQISEILDKECYGQYLDFLPGVENLTREEVLHLYELKTSAYTTVGPVKIGCILAGASGSEEERLNEFAKNLGIAFQLQDDIRGVFSTQEEAGKPIDDIEEGKKTLLLVRTLEMCSEEERKYILENYGTAEPEANRRIKEIMEEC